MRVRRTRFLNINTPRDEQDFHGRTGVRRSSSGSGEAVLLQDAPSFNPPLGTLSSLPVPGVHENGYRPVVNQGNLHVRAKLTALHPAFQQVRQFLLEQFI